MKQFKFVAKIKHEIALPDDKATFSSHRLREIYLYLRNLKKIKKDKIANEFLKTEIKNLREELNSNLNSVYLLTIKNKNYVFSYFLENYNNNFSKTRTNEKVIDYLKNRYKDFYEAWDTFKKEISSQREKLKQNNVEKRDVLGFNYNLVGGVFSQNNSIVALQTIENQLNRITKPKKPIATQKSNYIGIELELIAKVDRETLNKILCENFLAGYVYVKHDGSIQKEQTGDYDHEVTVLCKESDVKMVVTRLCDILNSSKVKAYVNNSCGLHVHIDCRNRTPDKVYNNLVRILPMLKRMVPKSRTESAHAERYCKMNKTHIFTAAGGDRYTAVNGPDAFNKYKTVEVRMHSGTTNAVKIINWVKILCNAVNQIETFDNDIVTPEQFMQKTNCDISVYNYIVKRTKRFTGELADALDTRADHFFPEELEAAI